VLGRDKTMIDTTEKIMAGVVLIGSILVLIFIGI
jgi:hypothetical protein